MKYLKYTFLVAIILTAFSCSDDSSVNPIDEQLKKNIIGTWKNNNNYKIIFYNNNTFIDTVVEIHPLGDTVIVVRSGKYNITNSILIYSEFSIDTLISREPYLFGYYYYDAPYEIQINERTLYRKYVQIFENIGNHKSEIWDKWETKRWFAQYSNYKNDETYYGDYTTTYDFIRDSSICIITYKYHNILNDSLFEYQTGAGITIRDDEVIFRYTLGHLVRFINTKMYMYPNIWVSNLIKVD